MILEWAMLLWTLDEAGRQLGGLSRRTVQRLISRGEIPFVRIGRSVRIPVEALQVFVAERMQTADNQQGAEPVAWKGTKTCHINAQIHRSGMPVIPTRAAQGLDDLLKRLTGAKRKR